MHPNIKIYNKDCLPAMQKMEDNQFDLAIVDPPYGLDITSHSVGGRNTIKSDKSKNWDKEIPNEEYFNHLFRISKNQIIWGGNFFDLRQNKCFMIWDKGETIYGRTFAECEYAWSSFNTSDAIPRIFKKSPVQLNRIHTTQKPIALYKWLLRNYAKEGDKILDTHGGSMSIAIACWDYDFDLDLYEIDKDYFEAGKKRLEKHKKRPKSFFKETELQSKNPKLNKLF